jgi:hypothetical protein
MDIPIDTLVIIVIKDNDTEPDGDDDCKVVFEPFSQQ